KPGEPSWESPWGKGRPGWHIEWSAMASKYLGENFDIHGGGLDLIFPHHENEVAQSEAATGKPFARIWMHNGLINLGREKMSKSTGNIITIREFLKKYPVEALRFYILSAHYRNPMDFDEERVEEAIAALERFRKTMVRIQDFYERAGKEKPSASRGVNQGESSERKLLEEAALLQVVQLKDRFEDAMEDDFNTAKAIGCLFQVVRALNQYCDSLATSGETISKALIDQFFTTLKLYQKVFGLFEEDSGVWLRTLWEERARSVDLSPSAIEAKIALRLEARQRSNWELADAIRRELIQHGVMLEDSPDGTTWRVKRGGGSSGGF
ncbi:MAG: class I tRNA ligase family protein, partial [Deltaproteobacteria bacterium]|nr:class I tRNA ligase family protein [Deltaproteobacteria bacterium]